MKELVEEGGEKGIGLGCGLAAGVASSVAVEVGDDEKGVVVVGEVGKLGSSCIVGLLKFGCDGAEGDNVRGVGSDETDAALTFGSGSVER